tara:strand:- start:542 stop:895 length:354 start_codon:yes stop_codon:yes gene_type:complete
MYKVLLFFQIISAIILVFGILKLINKNTTFVLVTFIIVGLIFYMFYYIYVINNDRNQFYWDKSRVSDKLINQNSNNAQKRKQDRDKRQKLRNKQELAELDDTINKIVEDSKSNQCAN